MIEGSYDLNGRRMHSYNRIVIADRRAAGQARYLVQFTVTGYAEKAAEEAPDIESIIGGLQRRGASRQSEDSSRAVTASWP